MPRLRSSANARPRTRYKAWSRLRVAVSMSLALATAGVAAGTSGATPAFATTLPPVTISHVLGQFYPNPNNLGSFDRAQLNDLQFSENFPVIDFNPPAVANVFCQGGTVTNEKTRPITDVVRAPDGRCEDQPAIGGHWGDLQAGLLTDGHDLGNFEAVFRGSLTVNQPGDVTFNVFSDDGWIMGLGEDGAKSQAAYAGGSLVNAPPFSEAAALPVVGAYNELSSPTLRQVTVYFPTKGTYPLEVDYTEAHLGDLALTLGTTSETPIPSTYDGFPPGDWFGNQPDGGYASEPVNTATGNYTREEDDLLFPATVEGLNFVRTYNSMESAGGPLGLGWTANPYSRIDASDPDAITLRDWDGRRLTFHLAAGGTYTRPQQYDGSLVVNATGFTIDHTDGEIEQFDTAGRLTSRSFADGQRVTYTYGPSSLVTAATSSTGYSETFTYDATGLLTSVEASDGRAVHYAYVDGVLTAFTDATGATSSYQVDALGRIVGINDPDGHTLVANSYDELGRIATQSVAGGAAATFDYSDADGTTSVTASTGGSVVYTHDAYGRLSTLQDPRGAVVSRGYDAEGDITAATSRGGATITQTFDQAGDLLSRTAAGVTVTDSYDALQRVTSVTDPAGATTSYTYDGTRRSPSTVTDARGAVTRYIYDDNGRVLSVTDADGDTTSYTYDAAGQQTSVIDGTGATTTMTYDPAGNLASTTTPLGEVTSYTYDADGRLLATTDLAGAVTRNDYSPAGLLLDTVDPSGASTTYTYNAAGQQTSVTTPTGVTRYSYDPAGDLVSQTDPNGDVTSYSYDELGRRISSTAPDGHVTTYSYNADGMPTGSAGTASSTAQTLDDQGQVTSTTDALGRTTTQSHDTVGRLISVTDPTGATTTYTYDAVGNRLTETDPLGNTTTNTYTPAGRLASTTDPLGRTTYYSYDKAGRLAAVTDPAGAITRSSYDPDGDLTATTTPSGLVTRTRYDADQRPVSVTTPSGGVTTTTYSITGQPIAVTDASGATTRYSYDAGGDLTSVTGPTGAVTGYRYDAAGDTIAVTDPLGHITRYSYDSSRRVTGITDPLGRSTTIGYDTSGNPASIKLPSGRSQTMTYNPAGQLISRTAGDGSTVSYRYDADGRLTAMRDSTGMTSYSYDADGRITATTTPTGRTVTNTYDAAGQLTNLTYPDGRALTYAYDANGHISQVNDPTAGGPTTYTYNSDGQLTGETLPNGARAYSYTEGLLSGDTQQLPDTGDHTSGITRDADGRITSETRNGKTYSYSYDAAGELIGVTGQPAGPVSISYDAAGNRTEYTSGGATTSYAYNNADELLSATTHNATTSYTYDSDGRQTGATGKNTSTTTTYDAWGLPVSQTQTQPSGTQTYGYTHDGQGNIVAVTAASGKNNHGTASTTELLWSAPAGGLPQLIQATAGNQTPTDFIYGDNRIAADTGNQTASFAYDANGSAIATNDTRAWAIADGYDAFGVPNTGLHDNAPTIGFGYNGELTIGALQDLRARLYDPTTGRLLTPDTLVGAPGTVAANNPYTYARNDPRDLADPSGQSPAPDPTINALLPGLDQPLPDALPTRPQRLTGNAYADAFFAMSMSVFNELHATAVALTAVSARERFRDAIITTDMGSYFDRLISMYGGESDLRRVITLTGGYRPDVRVDEGLASLIYEVKYNGTSAYTVAIPQIAKYVALLTAAGRLAAPGPALPPSGPVETPSGLFELSVYPTPIPGLQVYDVDGGYPAIRQVILYRLNMLQITAQEEADGKLQEKPDGSLVINGRTGLNLTQLQNLLGYESYDICFYLNGIQTSCTPLN